VKILFYDIIQLSDAPKELRTAALADAWSGTEVTIALDQPRLITCAGIGHTDASYLSMSFALDQPLIIDGNSPGITWYDGGPDAAGAEFGPPQYDVIIDSNFPDAPSPAEQIFFIQENGLYRIKPVIADRITLAHDGAYIGRFGAGEAVDLRTAIAKEPGWASTAESRKTLSGQILPGAGGYSYRTVSLDARYKIDERAVNEIEAAYPGQIAQGYPFFLLFDREAARLPFLRLYAQDAKYGEYVLQGGVNRYLFSRKFEFVECF
jgi:hypothetical protein